MAELRFPLSYDPDNVIATKHHHLIHGSIYDDFSLVQKIWSCLGLQKKWNIEGMEMRVLSTIESWNWNHNYLQKQSQILSFAFGAYNLIGNKFWFWFK